MTNEQTSRKDNKKEIKNRIEKKNGYRFIVSGGPAYKSDDERVGPSI